MQNLWMAPEYVSSTLVGCCHRNCRVIPEVVFPNRTQLSQMQRVLTPALQTGVTLR